MNKVITNNLDLWTSALLTKSTAGRGSNGRLEAYGIKKLRELILELAVRGKLVPQDPSDEPASELLKKIATEKAEPIRAGKAKKERSPAKANDEEMRFALPKSWTWIPLGGLAEILDSQRKPITKTARNAGPYPYYGASGVVDYVSEYIFDEALVLVGEDGAKWGRGDSTAFPISGKTWVNNHAHVLRPNRSCILDAYLVYFLTVTDLNKYITGMTVPKLNQARLVSIPVALPPFAEQHRIVAKVEELMVLCDELEQQQTDSLAAHQTLIETLLGTLIRVESQQEFSAAWVSIASHFDTLFTTEASIDQLKQTILQLAVMGKLVPQDPNDEPASFLLKRIKKDRYGKIKKGKSSPEISDNEKFFVLPAHWSWARLGDYALVVSGNAFSSQDFNNDSGVKVVKITNAGVGEFVETNDFLPLEFIEKYKNFIVEEDDLILALTRPYISDGLKISKCPRSYHHALLNQRVAAIRTSANADYLYAYMQSRFVLSVYKDRFGSSGLQPNLKVSDVTSLLVPVPPKNEQQRIVAKVDELMALCDALKCRLADAQTTQRHLADAIVERSVSI